ncbi:branched-chain amino acid transport system II carrier protein [Vibrio sinensis]|uniref:Branched-chain amino acid transport system carrier protein n=1 Tax=Vibrio sinensis TaxID=2302434 RepID=A0A3A6QJW8_9VIBR|nr:branched-chain amino acid transport system II carrier protein [Vibrio sinensis]RJX72885.1 branched-chain amino acid transport system II carrier protein [Vibrio sinensis]
MLSARNIAALGFMTFAMYLGAGNLIFPPFLGYQAGEHFLSGMSGFLLTGVGLPALALVMVAIVNGSDKLTVALPKPLATSFWVLVFIVIGPAFVIPRAITVAYQFSFAPSFGETALVPFTAAFCVATIMFAIYPGKLIDNLGKILTPALMAILVIMSVTALVYPAGDLTTASGPYINGAFAEGLTQGYMTMDALGSIGFGWIIFRAIRSMGVECPKATAKYTLIAALMYAVAMAFVYISLSYIGSTSSYLGSEFTNGGDILTAFTFAHFGAFGSVLLGAVMVLACLTTAIGVTTAGSEFYDNTFSKLNYKACVIATMALAGFIANIGLEQLLAITLPAVVILHPVAIALMLMAPVRHKMSQVMVVTTALTALLFGGVDALHILGYMPETIDLWLNQNMPLYSYFASWIIPTFSIILMGMIMNRLASNQPTFATKS